MKRYLGLGVLMMFAGALSVQGQVGESGSQIATRPAQEVGEPTGDVITLRTGQVLTGVQILRETPRAYEILVVEGVAPLIIRRRQVASVVKDDYEPLSALNQLPGLKDDRQWITAQRIPQELLQVLEAPISNKELRFKEADYVIVLKDLAGRVKLPLVFGKAVTALPEVERLWTVTVEPGMNFVGVRRILLKKFPLLTAELEVNRMVVNIKVIADAPPAQRRR